MPDRPMTTQNDLITTAQNSTAAAAPATTTLLTTKKPTAAAAGEAATTTPTTIGYRSTTLAMSSTAPTITATTGVGGEVAAVPATKSAQIGLTAKATAATPASTPEQTLATATARTTTRTATTMATMFISTIYPTSTTDRAAAAAARAVPGLPLLSGRASLTSETDAHDSIEMATSLASGEENAVLSLPHPDSADALTKGFSIPTFLPPFPVFAAADLPAYRAAADAAEAAAAAAAAAAAPASASTMASETVTLSPEQERQQMFNEQHSYLASHNGQLQPGQLPRRNLTMPVLNITAQMGNHAYMPCQVSTKRVYLDQSEYLYPSCTAPSPPKAACPVCSDTES